jgi:hypothetical protein
MSSISSNDVTNFTEALLIGLVPLSTGICWFIFFPRLEARLSRRIPTQIPYNPVLDTIVLWFLRFLGLAIGVTVFIFFLLLAIDGLIWHQFGLHY